MRIQDIEEKQLRVYQFISNKSIKIIIINKAIST